MKRLFIILCVLCASVAILGCEGATEEELLSGSSGGPKAPSNLKTTAVLATQVSLEWDDNATNETGFKVERKKAAEPTYFVVKTLPENILSYSDIGLSPAYLYYYRVRAYNNGGDSSPSNEISVATPWKLDSIDALNSAGKYNSIVIDSNYRVHICYYNETTGDLKYANNLGGGWSTITLDSLNNTGFYTSIAVDSDNNLHISYRNADLGTLKYATNVSGVWLTYTIDNTGDVGEYTSIAVDSNDKICISYYDVGNKALKYATNVTGPWVKSTVDNAGDVGKYTSIAYDLNNNGIHISYYDEFNTALKYASNTTGTWNTAFVTTPLSGVIEGSYTSIDVNSAGNAFISYFDETNKILKCATNKLGTWQSATIDSSVEIGGYTSLFLSSDGIAFIAYYDKTNRDLKYATYYITSEFVNITTYPAVDSAGDVGQWCSIMIDDDKCIYISYYDATNSDLNCAVGR